MSLVTVTLPLEEVRRIRDNTHNVSGLIAQAVADRLRLELLRGDLAAYQVEHGAFTPDETKQAQRDLTPWAPTARAGARSSSPPNRGADPSGRPSLWR